MGSRQSTVEMSRNKSIIRSSSSGSYPYPRTHTTLMVIPSNRPPPPPQPVKMFTGVRRRPPLNRACPPIPESKSNESIMSHASRISEHQKAAAAAAATSETTTGDLVIENRNVVDVLHRLDANSNIALPPSSNIRKSKEKKAKMSSTPRSPLMSMANSVKSKLTKITHLGRSSNESSGSSSNIKTSQSFSGIRQPKQIPKRIDQNANRVIKSSSMEVPSTSKVCIPQDPTPLIDDKIEEISEAGLISKSEMAPPKPKEHVCVKLEEDVLVVTKEFDERYPGQKRSASPDVPMVEESQTMSEVDQLPSEQVAETFSEDNVNELDNNANQKTPGPVRRIIQETTTTTITTTTFDSPIPIIEKMEVERPEEAEDVIVIEAPEPVQPPIPSPKKERFTSPERYILLVKTPEALRKHRTLTIGEKDPTEVDTEEKIQYTRLETVKFKEVKEKVKYEEPVPKEKFILTMKTPEAIRRHHTFTIRDKSPEEMNKITKITKSQSDVHVSKRAAKKLVKQASEPERRDLFEEKEDVVPEPKFVIVMKTPECLRRHHTFTIGDRPKSPDYPYIEEGEITEPIATIGPPADRRKKEEAKERKKREWEEYETPPKEKFILTTTTPLAIRKYQTFVVEPKDEKTALPQSASADAVMLAKKGKVQRSESTDSKKHSYLRRLQFELFRGRSRERKSEKQEKRQKSLDERKPESAQKYILSTTTPIMMRKYQTFAIVDGGKSRDIGADTNLQSIASAYQQKDMSFDEEKTTSPVRTSDFYSITATTPLAKRRVVVEENVTSSIQQLSLDEPITSPSRKPVSPEPRHLFVMGGRRSTTPQEDRKVPEPPRNLKLDTDRSQSDHAELLEERKSTMSGDLTSPEEEIPMDTNLTPTTEEVMEAVIVSRRIEGLMTSPIEEEPEGLTSSIRDLSIRSLAKETERPAPVFTPPSPPKENPFHVMTVPKSTLTSSSESAMPMTSSSSSIRAKPNQLPIKKTIQVVDPMHIVELKPEHKSKKEALAAKSLRNAGKMLTPSFLRKEKKGPKKSLYAKTTSSGRQHISEKKEKKAPLAEGESTVVANSPLVENLPITFEKWSNKSPRLSVKHFNETIIEETLDANANSMSPQLEHRVIPTSHHVQDNTGLIDDDILDQPMLVGDTFSHSSSIDCISAHLKMNESIISIDRSLPQNESRSSNHAAAQNNANRNTQYIETSLDRQIDAGRSEVQDIKSQLQKLNRLVNEMGVSGWEEELTRLRRENEQLRRELAERDATIAALQSQTVSS
ncbi:Flocculation protein FLO11-like [Caenorhabditis elegans]|nr:Flocculation protein FLO11-like [Caenorhabditis elegans]CCD69727.1 Flocculation protein FLO11-like [Caenorhabditis elegans]|eukprot:NP_001023152.2 Uncharacterized protein CELE_F28E10.1 [Caenorhabditis elegans]